MMKASGVLRLRRVGIRSVFLAATALALSACVMNQQSTQGEGIGFREARFQEISAMRDYRACRDDALELDTQARTTGNIGRYLASAELLEKCETELGPETAGVAKEERMRAYALSVQNYLKGGDVHKAAANLEKFKRSFPDKDLYYADGSSFTTTMEALLGQKDKTTFGRFAAKNISHDLAGEMRRVRYWKHN